MAKKATQLSDKDKLERLRALRLEHEAARREAGTWGQVSVGEILHQASNSVFMQMWKGRHRPDPFDEGGKRRAGASAADWSAMLAWIAERNSPDFSQRVVGWDLTAAAARKMLADRTAEHRAAGLTVMNTLEPAN